MTESNEQAFNDLEAVIRESFGRVVYAHKTHEKCADDGLYWLVIRKRTQTFLSALSSVGFLATALEDKVDKHLVMTITGGITVVLTFLTFYMQGNNAADIIQKHSDTANKLWLIRETYVSLLADIRSRVIDLTEVRKMRDELIERLSEIYRAAPRTNSKAYGAAQEGLKNQEELTFNDDEIDKFLPAELRKKSPVALNQTQA